MFDFSLFTEPNLMFAGVFSICFAAVLYWLKIMLTKAFHNKKAANLFIVLSVLWLPFAYLFVILLFTVVRK